MIRAGTILSDVLDLVLGVKLATLMVSFNQTSLPSWRAVPGSSRFLNFVPAGTNREKLQKNPE